VPRLAVVGGRGWLGSAIVDAARQRGLDVLALSRTPTPGACAVDPTDTRALAAALSGCAAVVNAAGALPGRGGTDADLVRANVELPARVAALAAASGRRLVHVGSASEYGPVADLGGEGRVAEDRVPAPITSYGRTKLAGTEAVLAQWAAGAPALVARVFNVVDGDLPPANPVHDLVAQVLAGLPARGGRAHEVAVGDPTTVRDIALRPWVADAVVALAVRPELPPAGVVNVCTGAGTSFGELAVALGRRVGLAVTVRDRGWPRGGRVVGDPRRLRALVPPAPTPSADDLATALVPPSRRSLQTAGDRR
jgi:nucleoside-diphosphate-sugar epimerase